MVSATRSSSSALRAASRVVGVAAANIANARASVKPEDLEVEAISAGRKTGKQDAPPDSGGYAPVRVVQESLEGGGVRARVGAIAPPHLLVVDPSDPAANQDGLVARPNVDTEAELLNVSRARRAYQSSLKVIEIEDEMAGSLIDSPT